MKNALNLTNLLENASNTNNNDPIAREYYSLGFANKFYTLWVITERKYSKSYFYCKNVSMSEEKARALYPECEIDPELKGKSRSFTVSIGGEDCPWFGALIHKSVEPGAPVSISRFIVTGVAQHRTNRNKPYMCFTGEDIEGLDIFAVSVFDFTTNMPAKGDVIKLDGTIAFYNEKQNVTFLNDCTWSFVDDRKKVLADAVEDGDKLKDVIMVLTGWDNAKFGPFDNIIRGGYVNMESEDGELFTFDTSAAHYRTGRLVQKFEDPIKSQLTYVGSTWKVSGTVQKKNGFNRLIRVKLELVDKGAGFRSVVDPDIYIPEVNFYHIARLTETIYTPNPDRRKRDVMTKYLYNIETSRIDDMIKSIINYTIENDGCLHVQGRYCEQMNLAAVKSIIEQEEKLYHHKSSQIHLQSIFTAAKTRVHYTIDFFEE